MNGKTDEPKAERPFPDLSILTSLDIPKDMIGVDGKTPVVISGIGSADNTPTVKVNLPTGDGPIKQEPRSMSVDPGFDVLADVRALLIDTNKRDAVLVELLSMFKELGVKVDKVTAFEERLNLDHERLARVESMLAFYLQNISAQVDALALDASGKPQKMTVPLYNLWMQAWSQFLKSKGGAQNETRKD